MKIKNLTHGITMMLVNGIKVVSLRSYIEENSSKSCPIREILQAYVAHTCKRKSEHV